MLTLVLALVLAARPANLTHAAGFPVRCQPISEWGARYQDGAANLQTHVIYLSPEVCKGFRQTTDHDWTVDSLVTLGHERAHLLGVQNEHAADCKGLRDAPWLARRLRVRLRRVWVRRYVGQSDLTDCL